MSRIVRILSFEEALMKSLLLRAIRIHGSIEPWLSISLDKVLKRNPGFYFPLLIMRNGPLWQHRGLFYMFQRGLARLSQSRPDWILGGKERASEHPHI